MDREIIDIQSKLYDYSVEFIDDTKDVLESFKENFVYVIDKNVYELYKQAFSNISTDRIYFMQAEEHAKNMNTVLEIINFWKSLGMQKNWKVICIGGGITQDVTTVASDLYLRNVDWYFFPTTLLSMCDSCIGGKCGINLGQFKNQIGVFYPPKKIFIDTHFINTLTHDDYLNGWGELLKFSLTSEPAFFEELSAEKQHIPCDNIKKYISWGLKTKKSIIEQDEFDSDLRRVLNYGHSFGHALEAYTQNAIPHGKAVIWGIDVANYLAFKENLISEEYYLSIKKLIKNKFLLDEIVIQNPADLFNILKSDKKVKGNTLNFAFLKGNSTLFVYPMELDERLKGLFVEYLEKTHEYYCH